MSISELVGKVVTKIENNSYRDELLFHTDSGTYIMHHLQSCCENVSVDDIVGDLDDLLNSEILNAEEITECGDDKYISSTWTFYKIATIKGYITIKWYGTSNGYYSEKVSFYRIGTEKDI